MSLDSRSLRSNNASASFIDFILSSKVSFLYLRKKTLSWQVFALQKVSKPLLKRLKILKTV
ncbi:hypothetical protein CU026_2340 [Enterococcus faecium]|nr:hypothetical protein [Enterococcus faecium]MBK4833156.1 hypothetical protein [Enterococcus faecium]